MVSVTLFVILTALATVTSSVTYENPVVPGGRHVFAIARHGNQRWLTRYDLAAQRVDLRVPISEWSHTLVVSPDGRRAVIGSSERDGVVWELGSTTAKKVAEIDLWDPSVPEHDVFGHLTPTQLVAGGARLVAMNTDAGTAWIATLGPGETHWERLPDTLNAVSEDGGSCLVDAPPRIGPCQRAAELKPLPIQEGSRARMRYGFAADPRFSGDILLYDVLLVDSHVNELTAWSVKGKRLLWSHASSWIVPQLFPQADGTLWVRSTLARPEGDTNALLELDPKDASIRRQVEVGEATFSGVTAVGGVLYATSESDLFPIRRWDLAKGERLPDLAAPKASLRD